ncbi:Chaperonin-like RbcX protein [Perilla frutescens var. hirtella]|uniref:Chaperonin-like RbcX protein n=1 Tax=Perilla frutescens var. hirtella TaxID=608512 RepID=A0AAD4P5E6_PERFH|nr:Chaperonin-like RbcX protein [Perilla frutescens var. hirtella]
MMSVGVEWSYTKMISPHSCSIRKRAVVRPSISRSTPSTTLQCHKMYVPGFGEASPEAKSAKHLHDFFTYVASYNPEAYADMMKFLENHSVSDGDKFCADLMRESSNHKALALRILEVRSAYCKTDFEWDNLKRLASEMVEERNTKVMRDYLSETTPVENETDK